MHAAGWDRAALYLHLDEPADPAAGARFRASLQRRLKREPAAYIVGQREFYGLGLTVDPRVLIPRPETEQIVEEALRWLAGWRQARPPVVVDVGTGSGAIAIAVATHSPIARLFAVDHSAGALEVAGSNATRHGVADRIAFLEGDLLRPAPRPVDLILANLPYIPTELISTLEPEVRDYEPRLALDGGPTGLTVIERLLEQAVDWLSPGGALLLEIGDGEGDEAVALAARYFATGTITRLRDLAQRDRVLSVQAPPESDR